jgi:hypothetical protein
MDKKTGQSRAEQGPATRSTREHIEVAEKTTGDAGEGESVRVRTEVREERARSRESEIADQSDLKKERRPGVASESVRAGTQFTARAWGGLADAVAQAFEKLDDDMDTRSVEDRGVSNALLEAVLAGQARFFARMAEASRDMLRSVQEWGETSERPPAEIDYDRLARLIADELERRRT